MGSADLTNHDHMGSADLINHGHMGSADLTNYCICVCLVVSLMWELVLVTLIWAAN